MTYENEMKLIISSNSKNESFARATVAAFASQLDPTLVDIEDIKMAVSEAVTNAIIHGYDNQPKGDVTISCGYLEGIIYIEVKDNGTGIDDIEKAMLPLYTSKPLEERSGMGFTVMQSFMDDVEVISSKENGTLVKMSKKIARLN